MSKADNHHALNRLLTVLYRSLPMYLMYASPWTHRGDEPAVAALKRIAEDQERLATRIAQYVIDQYGRVELGDYPLDFPDTHDLALDYLVGKIVACQKNDVAKIEQVVAALRDDPKAAALAEEALGAARGHLETLEELSAETAKHGVSWAKP
jgi:hypothetical protein